MEEALADMQRVERRLQTEPASDESGQFERDYWMPTVEFRQRMKRAAHHHSEAQQIKWRLVDGHLWMVPMIARNYSCTFLTFMDLVQEGNLGLIRATDACSEGFDCRFSSYAGWWIRQAITRAIDEQERLIRLPSYVSELATKLHKARQSLEQTEGREVDDEEVAWHASVPISRARRVMKSFQSTLSIHECISPDGDELGDLIADERCIPADELAAVHDLTTIVQEALSILTIQEREVMLMRFGLLDGDLRTNSEIGRTIGLTKQRIQQIESTALTKLRHPSRLRRLSSWL